jgi:hypothetical protein
MANGIRLLWRVFVGLTVLCLAGALVGSIARDPHNWIAYTLIGAIFAGVSLLLGWGARLAWERVRVPGVRWLACALLGYHALFGLVLLGERAILQSSCNDDWSIVLWPHVVRAINSLE